MKWVLVFVTVAVSAVSGAAAYYYLGQAEGEQASVAQPEIQAETATGNSPVNDQSVQEPSIEKKFETFLNDLLKDVSEQMTEYREQRKVLVESIKPVNLRSPEYVKENYLMVQSLAPSLRQNMDALMQVFPQAGAQVESLVSTQDPEAREAILAKWKEMEKEQIQKYVSFFAAEEKTIGAYEALISFLNETSQDFTVDLENDRIVYKNPQNDARYRELLTAVEKPAENQEEAVKGP